MWAIGRQQKGGREGKKIREADRKLEKYNVIEERGKKGFKERIVLIPLKHQLTISVFVFNVPCLFRGQLSSIAERCPAPVRSPSLSTGGIATATRHSQWPPQM